MLRLLREIRIKVSPKQLNAKVITRNLENSLLCAVQDGVYTIGCDASGGL